MSGICCNICKYWLSELNECGNTHVDKCIDKEYFVKSERNCGTCEVEIHNEAIDECISLTRKEIDFESQSEQMRFVEFMEGLKK